jgi:hypothetical protein
MAKRASGVAVCSQKGRPVSQQPKETRSTRRTLVIAVALPLLYVLSSGPALSLAFTWHQPTVHDNGDGDLGITINLDEGLWWPVVYAPLQMGLGANLGRLALLVLGTLPDCVGPLTLRETDASLGRRAEKVRA